VQTSESSPVRDRRSTTEPPNQDWKRPPGDLRITQMKTVLNDLELHNLTLTEAVNPLWRLLAASGALALCTLSGAGQK